MTPPATIISGKVVLDEGTPLSESAEIQTICKGQKRTETHTDSHGNFSLQFGSSVPSSEYGYDADSGGMKAPMGRPERRDLAGCELQASLAGFRSESITLDGRVSQSDNVDIGRIVLHRLQNVEGLTISATTAMAPDPARKAWQKGRKQAQQGKWEDAQESLKKAVGLYPNFAAAWFDLGEIQLNTDSALARHSFEQAIAADSKYIKPYLGLAQLAMRSRNWVELTLASEKILALNPFSFPDVWFWDGMGHYNLQDFAAAEKSARRGVEIDTEHRVPNLEYLLAMALVAKKNYSEASQHLRAFLSHATRPAEIAAAQKQLEQIAHLSPSSDAAVEKK